MGDFQALKDWGNKEFQCECGLLTHNRKKKEHLGSELHECLLEIGNKKVVKGTDKLKCPKCRELKTVCGFPTHIKFCKA